MWFDYLQYRLIHLQIFVETENHFFFKKGDFWIQIYRAKNINRRIGGCSVCSREFVPAEYKSVVLWLRCKKFFFWRWRVSKLSAAIVGGGVLPTCRFIFRKLYFEWDQKAQNGYIIGIELWFVRANGEMVVSMQNLLDVS